MSKLSKGTEEAILARNRLRVLVLSFYFWPDLSAGSFRATSLVNALCKVVPTGSHIDVITARPNRYHSFAVQAPEVELQAGLSIFRVAVQKHESGMLDQPMAFLGFSYRALRRVAGHDYDIVFATSSRLMTALLGALIARWKKAGLYLDIRDIFVDTIKYVLPRMGSRIVRPVFSILERWTIRQADKVNLVSPGFLQYFQVRYPQQRFSLFTNGVDDEFLAAAPTHSSVPSGVVKNKPATVVYAGNLGESQGLHMIVPELANLMGPRVHFKIIGDGSRKRALQAALLKNGVTNVELLPPVNRNELLEAYCASDVLFLHLNDYEAFTKVLPSKLFEYAALGKPVWAGISGYSEDFVRTEIDNVAVFHPCDVEGAMKSFETLRIQDIPRTAFIAKYSRANISQKMAQDIVAVAMDYA